MFYLKEKESGNVVIFNTKQLLEMLNRDRSYEWSEYTENSTLKEITEGIDSFTDYLATF